MPDRPHYELLQRQARALGDPTRHELFRRIEESAEPPGVRELADGLGLHPSAVRQHLAKLVAAELVVELPQPPAGPGRPRSLYQRAAGVVGVWTSDNPFERLAALLVDAVRTDMTPRDAGRAAGRSIARSHAVRDASLSAVDVLESLVAAQGFAPAPVPEDGGRTLVLGRCPYASVATVAPDVVCELHLGVAEGMAEALPCPDPVEVVGLTRAEPLRGGCRLMTRQVATAKARETP